MLTLTFPFYGDGDRFSPGGVRRVYILLGGAILALVSYELANRQWDVQSGLLCGRHLLLLPRAPGWSVWVEWAAALACGAVFLTGRPPAAAVRAAAVVVLYGAGQRYMNQKALLGLILAYLALDPPDPDEPGFEARSRPNLGLAVWQLALVYGFSALQKGRTGFLDGRMLVDALTMAAETGAWTPVPAAAAAALLGASPAAAAALSWLVVAAEAVLSCLVWARPRLLLAGALALHAGFFLLIPGTLSFALTMTACALLAASRRS
ncbi:MAG: hypothetical protein HYZ75_14830 [Elusimicrobia bacterium]|nr:hypothetical protein [Elusimicrobiota bacterium]